MARSTAVVANGLPGGFGAENRERGRDGVAGLAVGSIVGSPTETTTATGSPSKIIKNRWKSVVNQTLEKYGMKAKRERQMKDLGEFARDEIFRIVKFPQQEHLQVKKKPAKLVMKHMGYDKTKKKDVEEFSKVWKEWMRKHVRSIINEKRSSVSQSIGKHLINQVWPGGGSAVKPTAAGWSKIEDMRKNNQAYGWFVDNALSFVVGRGVWKEKRGEELLDEWANPGDEALALVLLENSWEAWCARYNARHGKKKQKGDIPRPKYTVQVGPTKNDKETAKEKRSWSDAGLQRFNTWRNDVKANRKEDQETPKDKTTNTSFHKWYKAQHEKVTKKRKVVAKSSEEEVHVDADYSDSGEEDAFPNGDGEEDRSGDGNGNDEQNDRNNGDSGKSNDDDKGDDEEEEESDDDDDDDD